MPELHAPCPNCGNVVDVSSAQPGADVECKHCSNRFRISELPTVLTPTRTMNLNRPPLPSRGEGSGVGSLPAASGIPPTLPPSTGDLLPSTLPTPLGSQSP